jgi:hypothetical protein
MVCSLKKQGFGWSYFFSITNRPIREQTQVDIISYFSREHLLQQVTVAMLLIWIAVTHQSIEKS